MKVLVLNCGSSSLKCQLIDMENEERIMKGHYDRIGGSRSSLRFNVRGNKKVIEHPARDFKEAISEVLNLLASDEYKVIKSFDEIGAVGHRIVHGGEKIKESVIIDDEIFDSYDDELIKKLVKISNGNGHNFGEGLLPKDIDEIIKRLGRNKEKEEIER